MLADPNIAAASGHPRLRRTLISVRGARYFKQLADQRHARVDYIEVENGWHDFRPRDPRQKTNYTPGQLDRRSIDFLIHHLLDGIEEVKTN